MTAPGYVGAGECRWRGKRAAVGERWLVEGAGGLSTMQRFRPT